jgi:hypothetical protein
MTGSKLGFVIFVHAFSRDSDEFGGHFVKHGRCKHQKFWESHRSRPFPVVYGASGLYFFSISFSISTIFFKSPNSLAMDEQDAHALRVGSAAAFAFALAVLRLVLVVHALVFAWVGVRP